MDARRCKYRTYLLGCSPCDVHFLELVETSEHTSTSNTSEDIGTSSLHHGHEAFILQDLGSAVNGALVFDSTARGHHHTPPNSINWVGHKSSSDSHTPAKEERKTNTSTISNQNGLQGVEHAEVHATVDEDTNGRDGESSVQSLDTIRLEGLHIHINEAIELALTSLALGIVSQPSSGIIKRVHKQQRHGTGSTTAGNVGCELCACAGGLGGGKDGLDSILEGKVKSLSGEVSEDVSQVSSPQGVDTLGLQYSGGAVNDTFVWLVKSALLDHLILVLDEELDSLNGGSSGLGHTGSHTSEHEVLKESEFLISHFDNLSWPCKEP